jgi:hypothetical protein
MANSSSDSCFVLELPLLLGDDELRLIEKRLEFARNIYNATLGTALGRIDQRRQDKRWKEALALPRGEESKALFKAVCDDFPLSDFECQKIAVQHAKKSGRSKVLYSAQIERIGTRVWKAVDEWLQKKHGKPRFKSKRKGLHSVECKKADAGVVFDKETKQLFWLKRAFRVITDPNDAYQQEALSRLGTKKEHCKGIKYNRLVRRDVKGRTRIYLQIVCEGNPPIRHAFSGKENLMAIDPSLQAVNCYSPEFAGRLAIAPHSELHLNDIRRLQRKLDRSRRVTNPECFNEDGTFKKGAKLKKFSKNYQKTQMQLQEVKRKEAVLRKCEHGESINLLLSFAGTIRIEKNSYKAFQMARFGKTLAKAGMGNWVTRLKSKAESAGLKVIEVSPKKLKFSQYEPASDSFHKKPLGQRWIRLDDQNLIHRDTLSAIEIYYADLSKEKHNPKVLLAALEGEKLRLSNGGLWKCQSAKTGSHELFAPDPAVRTAERIRCERLSGLEATPFCNAEKILQKRQVSKVAGAVIPKN